MACVVLRCNNLPWSKVRAGWVVIVRGDHHQFACSCDHGGSLRPCALVFKVLLSCLKMASFLSVGVLVTDQWHLGFRRRVSTPLGVNSTTVRLIMFCVTVNATHLSALAHSLWYHCDWSLHKSARTQRLPRTWSVSSWLDSTSYVGAVPRTARPQHANAASFCFPQVRLTVFAFQMLLLFGVKLLCSLSRFGAGVD